MSYASPIFIFSNDRFLTARETMSTSYTIVGCTFLSLD